MRALIFGFFIVLALPALAADWGHYANGRFGYGIDIPPTYEGLGEADNGDGQVFRSANGQQTLTVWGGNVIDIDFAAEIDQRMGGDKADGWTVTYQSTTPKGASYSATRAGFVLYARAIALCGGTQAAYFRLEYSTLDLARLKPVVERLVQSFDGPAAC